RRGSATRFRVLCRDVVEVSAELVAVDGRRVPECGNNGVTGNEPVTSHRCQFSDWGAVARDDESLSVIKATHDLAAVIPQLPLGDRLWHAPTVAPCATVATNRSRSAEL